MRRQHPIRGWLWLAPADWRQTLQRQVEERDRLDDANHSGPAPAFVKWVNEQQMPALARNPDYHPQLRGRIDELQCRLESLQNDINRGRLDLEPAAGQVRRGIKWLSELINA